MSVLNQVICLSLNAKWQPCKQITVRKAIENMTSNPLGDPPEYALDMDFGRHLDGTVDWNNITHVRAVTWEEWLLLPVRDHDPVIHTKRFGAIRAPTVTICSKFSALKFKEPKLSKRAIAERDGYVCQYTGRKLKPSEGNVDHVIPRHRGGKDRWENLVWADKKLNRDKGHQFNHEAGLKLARQPKKPKAMPVSFTITEVKHDSWLKFLAR